MTARVQAPASIVKVLDKLLDLPKLDVLVGGVLRVGHFCQSCLPDTGASCERAKVQALHGRRRLDLEWKGRVRRSPVFYSQKSKCSIFLHFGSSPALGNRRTRLSTMFRNQVPGLSRSEPTYARAGSATAHALLGTWGAIRVYPFMMHFGSISDLRPHAGCRYPALASAVPSTPGMKCCCCAVRHRCRHLEPSRPVAPS